MSVWSQFGFQEAASTTIELLNYFHDYMIIILLIVLVFVSYLFVRIISFTHLDKYTVDSHVLETVWTVLPVVILLFMAFPSLYLLYLIEDVSSPSLTVKVIGHQWYWEYQYSNSWLEASFDSYMLHDSSAFALYYNLDVDNRLVLPSSSTILFLVSSADVLHSWTVPALGIKCDSVPGRLNYLVSYTPYCGVYYGQCREICGSNHRFMPIVLEFVAMEDFINHLNS